MEDLRIFYLLDAVEVETLSICLGVKDNFLRKRLTQKEGTDCISGTFLCHFMSYNKGSLPAFCKQRTALSARGSYVELTNKQHKRGEKP